MSEDLNQPQTIQIVNSDLLVDSRTIAEMCQIQHESAYKLLNEHKEAIEGQLGTVRFEIAPSKARGGGGDGQRYALLTEDQATALITMFRNTPPVIAFKIALSRAFGEAKAKIAAPSTAALSRRDLAMLVIEEADRADKAEAKLLEQAPKAAFHDAVAKAINAQTIQEAAKVMDIGPNILFAFLRDQKLLMKSNLPYQQYIDAGYFRVVERERKHPNTGEVITYPRTLITGKGLVYVQKRWADLYGGQGELKAA